MIKPEQWRPAGGLTLEPNAQRAATSRNGNLALTAGPGAGKSEMLAQRADFLLRTGTGRYPKRILAISFKVDASRNIKDRVMLRCGENLGSRFDSHTFHGFAKRIIDRFRVVLRGRDKLDPDYTIGANRDGATQITFGDLLPLALTIVRTSAVARNCIRATYSDVFLDEFQDCTTHQYELVRLLFAETPVRLVSVGDTKQKIMGWAGALEGIFETFAQDFSATPLNLYRNFRSEPRLLRLQNNIIAVMDPASVMPVEQLEGDKGLLDYLSFDTPSNEASGVANLIQGWLADGVPPKEIAILISRQIAQYGKELMEALKARGIAFRNEHDLQDDLCNPVVTLFIDYIRILSGDRNPDSYVNVREFADRNFHAEWAGKTPKNNWDTFLKAEAKAFRAARPKNRSDVVAYLKRFMLHCGKPKFEDLATVSGLPFKEAAKRAITFISVRLTGPGAIHDELRSSEESEAVRILTVHKSKGLEFERVVFLGIEEETFFGKDDDERCTFFVGISRAKETLVFTSAASRPRPAGHSGRWDVDRSPHQEFLGYYNQTE